MRPPIRPRKAPRTQVVSGDGLLVGVDTLADLEPVLHTTDCSGMIIISYSSSSNQPWVGEGGGANLPTSIKRFVLTSQL